jgi:DNA-binding NtrC family response regulator
MEKKILLVEDDVILCELTKEMLQHFDIETFTAYTMEEAVKVFKENHEEIGVCIMDMNLEQETGVDVFEALKEISTDFVPVLASGMFTSHDIEEYKEKGFAEIIQKPYSFKDLTVLVQKHLS